MNILRNYFFLPKSKWWCKKNEFFLKMFNTKNVQLIFLQTLVTCVLCQIFAGVCVGVGMQERCMHSALPLEA